MTIGGQRGAGDDALGRQFQGSLRMLPHGCAFALLRAAPIEESHRFIEYADIAGGDQVLGQHQQRPEQVELLFHRQRP